MLADQSTQINLFDANEVKPYANHPQIVAMKQLLEAHHNNRAKEFEKILRENAKELTEDPFLRDHVTALLDLIRYVYHQSIMLNVTEKTLF